MTARRGGDDPTSGRDRSDYYREGISKADRAFVERARLRVQQKVKRQRIIRLILFLVLAAIAYFLGPPIYHSLRRQGSATAEEIKGIGDGLREGVERRSGAEFEEGTP